MIDFKLYVKEKLEELKQERDELRIRVHLAKMETSEEWQKLEHKLQKFESKVKELGDATADASKDMGAAVKLLGEEIGDGFKKIAKHL